MEVQDILMLENGLASLAATCLCLLFANSFRRNHRAVVARYLAIIFAGVGFSYAMNVASLIANNDNPCLTPAYFWIRIVGLSAMCVTVIAAGAKLLFLNSNGERTTVIKS